MKKPLVIIAGPTATGKSKYSVAFSKRHKGSVISADSMQVYKHMDIGSAKISFKDMKGIDHYLVDVLEPKEEFHVARFTEMAKEALEDIYAKDRLPIVCGGTGFYIQALLYGADFSEGQTDEKIRNELERIAASEGADVLFERLRQVDPDSCNVIHKNNVKRVIRALEFYELTGKPISKHNAEQKQKESEYNFAFFVLNDNRDKLYEGIEKRVDQMVAAGLYDEVKHLADMGYTKDYVSMQGLGYKEVLDYLDNKMSLEDTIKLVQQRSRNYAKRQVTFFKHQLPCIAKETAEEIYEEIING